MARESASKVWTPGDPILFANTSAVDGSSSSGNATSNKRLPFATVRTTKQARQNKKDEGGKNREVYKSSAGPCQRQGTLSPWAKSAWKPGMPVKLAKAPLSTTTTIDATQLQNSFKGKEKEVPASLPDENRHAHCKSTATKKSQRSQGSHIPFQTKNIYEDPIPVKRESSSTTRATRDNSFTSVHAAAGDQSWHDGDSSVEFLGQRLHEKSSPLSNALRHFALAQEGLREAIEARNCQEEQDAIQRDKHARPNTLYPQYLPSASSSRHPARPIVNTQVRQYASRAFPSSPAHSDDGNAKDPWAVDWEDPVLNPALSSPELSYASDSSSLPELPFKSAVVAAKTPVGSLISPRAAVPTPATVIANTVTSGPAVSAPKASKTAVRKLKADGAAQRRHAKGERVRKREEEDAQLKRKHLPLSYDDSRGTAPAVWYFRGQSDGNAAFMGCDKPAAFRTSENPSLDEVLGRLKGPLGWDQEWEMSVWNASFTAKTVGKVALIQLGDRENIILYQVGASPTIPHAILDIIENPDIIKVGVHIKGDGQKLYNDFQRSREQPILPRGLIDLSELARCVHTEDLLRKYGTGMISMQRLVSIYLDRYLEKGEVRTSKWANTHLSYKQRKYAANDIFASTQLYQRIIGHADADNTKIDFEQLMYDLHVTPSPSRSSTSSATFKPRNLANATVEPGKAAAAKVTPRLYEAWNLWSTPMSREAVSQEMGIKESSVVNYILKALEADTSLHYKQERLLELTKGMKVRNDQQGTLEALLLSSRISGTAQT